MFFYIYWIIFRRRFLNNKTMERRNSTKLKYYKESWVQSLVLGHIKKKERERDRKRKRAREREKRKTLWKEDSSNWMHRVGNIDEEGEEDKKEWCEAVIIMFSFIIRTWVMVSQQKSIITAQLFGSKKFRNREKNSRNICLIVTNSPLILLTMELHVVLFVSSV